MEKGMKQGNQRAEGWYSEGISGTGDRSEVRRSYLEAVKLFEEMGAVVEETSLPTFDYALSAYYVIASAEVASNLSRFDGIRYGYRTDLPAISRRCIKTRGPKALATKQKRRIMLGIMYSARIL